MKKIWNLLLLSMLTTSCSLKEDTSDYVSSDSFWSTLSECEAGVRGCYIPLKSIYVKDFMVATEGVTDLMYIPSSTQDASLNISPATARFGVTMWKQAYIGIRNCNMAVEGILASPVDEDKKAALVAEVRTLRAHYWYLLTCLFGDVPYYEDVIRTKEDLSRIQRLPRMSAVETRAKLIAELQGCAGALPKGRACDVADGHAGWAFCQILIAKLALWNKDWDSAKAALVSLQEVYGELSTYPLEDIPFSKKNTPESIFEIQHAYEVGGISVYATLAAYMMPGKRASGTTVFDGVDIPEMGDQCATYNSFRPNKYYYTSLMPRKGNDRRKTLNLAWEWNGQQFESTASCPWVGPKFWCWGMYTSHDSNNYPVYRYADVLLMLSEVYNEQDDMPSAIACLNEVKERAGIATVTSFKTKEACLEEIQRERARELLGEWQRKFDLVRWGIWYKQTFNNNDYSYVRANILPCHRYYPIPDAEVGLSGGVLDNKEYEAYMNFND